jgi:phosphatidylserine/phosphatidylglycerophosphate/cardiolipin synthase-like enzyme
MSFSKILKYTALGIAGFFVTGEIYYYLVEVVKEKFGTPDEKREIAEAFCTQGAKNKNTYLTRQIKFEREESLFITEILENLLKSAQRQVHVAMYIFTNHTLFEALKEVRQRGVKVYVIVDHTMEAASGSQVQKMRSASIDVKIYSRATMHHKFCLIDAPSCDGMEIFSAIDGVGNDSRKRIVYPRHGLLITGSLNWTREALLSNVENIIVTSDEKLIKDYQRFFYDCWNEQ